jgi:hypothetical protein
MEGEKPKMIRADAADRRTGPRYVTSLPVRAEWDDPATGHIIEEGYTDNVGPEGTLVHLNRLLPEVGSLISLAVSDEIGNTISVNAEVIRLERNASHPQAALQLLDTPDAWCDLIWEPAAPKIAPPKPKKPETEDGESVETIH